MATLRFKVKRGSRDTLLATFDTTNLPSGSLSGILIEWYVKRTTTQSGYDIYKTSASGSQMQIIDATAGTVQVYLQQADTISLPIGYYYWAFKLTSDVLGVLQITPDTTHGDLAILDSAVF